MPVRIYLCYEFDGIYETIPETFDLEDFGGLCPVVGDILPFNGVASSTDPRQINRRELGEVIYRYVRPRHDGRSPTIVYLVLQVRSAVEKEVNIIGA